MLEGVLATPAGPMPQLIEDWVSYLAILKAQEGSVTVDPIPRVAHGETVEPVVKDLYAEIADAVRQEIGVATNRETWVAAKEPN